MKSHPHPERPDRLRAIAASFATAGHTALSPVKTYLRFSVIFIFFLYFNNICILIAAHV